MREDGLVQLEPNPHHRRAKLITMKERGEAAYRTASERQQRWAEAVAAELSPQALEAAGDVLRELQHRLAGFAASTIKPTEIEEI
jgi:DNA-binding MarR family transcriptional regulator